MDKHAFGAQSRPLLGAGNAAGIQAQAAAGGDHPVPRQAAALGQLAEGASHPACRSAEPGHFGQLAVADHTPGRHLREHRVQGCAARLPACRRQVRGGMLGGLFLT